MIKSKYTIYAENVSRGALDYMAGSFMGYDHTITTGLGAFNGIQEESMRMDIIMMEEGDGRREELLQEISDFQYAFCKRFNQECIFVTRSEVEVISL
jgi:hypothetical protein